MEIYKRTGPGNALCCCPARTCLFRILAACPNDLKKSPWRACAHNPPQLLTPAFFRDRAVWVRAHAWKRRLAVAFADVLRLLQADTLSPYPLVSYNVCSGTCCLSLLFLFRGTCADTSRWEMAAELEPLMAEWLGAEKAEDTQGSEGGQGRWERGFGSW